MLELQGDSEPRMAERPQRQKGPLQRVSTVFFIYALPRELMTSL